MTMTLSTRNILCGNDFYKTKYSKIFNSAKGHFRWNEFYKTKYPKKNWVWKPPPPVENLFEFPIKKFKKCQVTLTLVT